MKPSVVCIKDYWKLPLVRRLYLGLHEDTAQQDTVLNSYNIEILTDQAKDFRVTYSPQFDSFGKILVNDS